MVRLMSPRDGEVVEILTQCQLDFTGGGEGADLKDWLDLHCSGKQDCTFPRKIAFEWESDGGAELLEVSENAGFATSRQLICRGGRAEMGNFKTGTSYYWRVNGCAPRKFTTQDATPRWMEIDGLSNVRDIGGWKTVDGRRIKQGLLYRGSEMDTHHEITDAGRRVMRGELGIRTDLDLRGEAVGRVTESPAGSELKYLLIPCLSYDAFMADEQKPTCKALFDVLADADLYPIYFHCWGGADRTGTLALMLESVLGLSDDDLIRDYELTSLSIWDERSRNSEWFRSLMRALEEYGSEGESIRAKALRFLRSCGIDDDTFEKLRSNLLE